MNKVMQLFKRHCLVFLRDRSAVFFSLLSMFIVLLLMVVFLGDMNVEEVTSRLNTYGGPREEAVDQANAKQLVAMWTIAGILVVNAVTVTLTVIGTMVKDSSEKRLASFYTAPVPKTAIAISYILSAIAIGTLFGTLVFGVAEIYIYLIGGELLGIMEICKVIGLILLNTSVFSVIMYLTALFVKSVGAWSGIATIVSTLVGFFGAIYLPLGSLPEGIGAALKGLPVLHGASLMRKICCESILNKTFEGMPAEVFPEYKEAMGITVSLKDSLVSSPQQILFILAFGVIALIVIAIVHKLQKGTDR